MKSLALVATLGITVLLLLLLIGLKLIYQLENTQLFQIDSTEVSDFMIDITCLEQEKIDITCSQQDKIDIIGGQGHPRIDNRGTAPNQIDSKRKDMRSKSPDPSPLRTTFFLNTILFWAALLQAILVLRPEPLGHFEPYPLKGHSLELYRFNHSCPSASFSDACCSAWPTVPSTFSKSRKKTNQQIRACHGHATCPHCSCDLYYKGFFR